MGPPNVTNERREIHFSGRVQGVGFRYTARAIAGRKPVTGFVKNLADGRVLMVLEGQGAVLDQVVATIEEEMQRCIEHTACDIQPATGEFTTFEVRR